MRIRRVIHYANNNISILDYTYFFQIVETHTFDIFFFKVNIYFILMVGSTENVVYHELYIIFSYPSITSHSD